MRVKSDAKPEVLRELAKFSPIYDVLSNSVPMDVTIETYRRQASAAGPKAPSSPKTPAPLKGATPLARFYLFMSEIPDPLAQR